MNALTHPNVQLHANPYAIPIVLLNPTDNFNASVPASVSTVGGTTYWHRLISSALLDNRELQAAPILQVCPTVSCLLPYYRNPPPMQHPCLPYTSASQQLKVKDLAELISFSKKNPLADWKLSQYNGNPVQWNEWYAQFRSAIDLQTLTDAVKLNYLKTL